MSALTFTNKKRGLLLNPLNRLSASGRHLFVIVPKCVAELFPALQKFKLSEVPEESEVLSIVSLLVVAILTI